MTWILDLDDFSGSFCGTGRYPLLEALNAALGADGPAPTAPQNSQQSVEPISALSKPLLISNGLLNPIVR